MNQTKIMESQILVDKSVNQAESHEVENPNLEAINRINLKMEHVNLDQETFLYNYFYEIRNCIDINSEKLIATNESSLEKLNKIKDNQKNLIDKLNVIESTCLENLKATKDIYDTSTLIERFKKRLPDQGNSKIEELLILENDLDKETLKYTISSLSGYNISNFNEASLKFSTETNLSFEPIFIACCYDYKIKTKDNQIEKMTIDQALLVYKFESLVKVKLDKLHETSQLMFLFTKQEDSEEAIELLKLFCSLDFIKLTDFNYDLANFFTSNDFFQKNIENNVLVMCIGLILNVYDINNHLVRNNIFNKIIFILSHPKCFEPKLRVYLHKLLTLHFKFLTKNQLKEAQKWILRYENGMSSSESESSDSDEYYGNYLSYYDRYDHSNYDAHADYRYFFDSDDRHYFNDSD